ncbi:response regulator [Pseudoduganella violaceinigra]|uniref:response regulator n=1 Tax=Pseudoduganella violaceinigra TaxID=246602 RepID=UPI000426FEA5|nr:response regulator [Pseudoduganella violaceinigra]
MTTDRQTFAVRLVGFPRDAERALAQGLERAPADGPAFLCLAEDSLRDPDIYLANGTELKALAVIASLAAGDIRPALVLGATGVTLPFTNLPFPVQWHAMYAELARLVTRRADLLAGLAACGQPLAPERRRRERLDLDLTEPAVYERMRKPRREGAVLCVDANAHFSEQLAQSLTHFGTAVLWAVDGVAALAICRKRPVAVVLLDFAAPIIDHYLLCAQLRGEETHPDVVFLVQSAHDYDITRGRAAGAAGMLDKPLAESQIQATLRKFMRL